MSIFYHGGDYDRGESVLQKIYFIVVIPRYGYPMNIMSILTLQDNSDI